MRPFPTASPFQETFLLTAVHGLPPLFFTSRGEGAGGKENAVGQAGMPAEGGHHGMGDTVEAASEAWFDESGEVPSLTLPSSSPSSPTPSLLLHPTRLGLPPSSPSPRRRLFPSLLLDRPHFTFAPSPPPTLPCQMPSIMLCPTSPPAHTAWHSPTRPHRRKRTSHPAAQPRPLSPPPRPIT